jgi:hypothetical protein
MAFRFKEDRPLPTKSYPTPASTAIGEFYPLKLINNALALATVGAPVEYLAQGTKSSSDAATTPIDVIPIRDTDIFIADIGTGTMSDAFVGDTCDLKSGATHTLDLTADVKHDVTIVGWDGVDTTKCYCKFNAVHKIMVP